MRTLHGSPAGKSINHIAHIDHKAKTIAVWNPRTVDHSVDSTSLPMCASSLAAQTALQDTSQKGLNYLKLKAVLTD